MSRPSIGLGLDRIFKSRPVLVLVSFEILFQDMSWSWSRLKISFKRSLGIGLERQKNQDKINTKKDNNKESKKMDFLLASVALPYFQMPFSGWYLD